MTGLGTDGAAGDGRGHLRASHADRERVIDQLKAAYMYGLVTKDEFDERIGQTFASRTYADLALVTFDIPAGLPALPPIPAAAAPRAPAGAAAAPADRALLVATAVMAIATFLALAAGLFLPNPAGGLAAIAGVGSACATMMLVARQLRATGHRDKPQSGQLPPRRTADAGLPSASPGALSQNPPRSLPRRGRSDAAPARRRRLQLAD